MVKLWGLLPVETEMCMHAWLCSHVTSLKVNSSNSITTGSSKFAITDCYSDDKNKINVVIEMLSWIKYHNQLQSTNNILCVCLS